MIRGDINGLTGYGISSRIGDSGTDIEVNLEDQAVDGVKFEDYIKIGGD